MQIYAALVSGTGDLNVSLLPALVVGDPPWSEGLWSFPRPGQFWSKLSASGGLD